MIRRPPIRTWLDGRRRRLILALVGVVHLAMALQLSSGPIRSIDPGVAILHEMLPLPLRIGMWLSLGLACLGLAVHDRTEWIGWAAAMVMPIERAASYAWSGLMWLIPGWPPGAVASWGVSLLWLAISGVLYVVATWEERPVWRSAP